MNKKVALVTDLKVIDSPQGGLGVARCLKDAGIEVIGADDTPLVTNNPRLFKKVFHWEELRNLNFDFLLKKISDIKKVYGLDYIFPCYDETVILFSFIKDKLDFMEIKLIAPPASTLKNIRKQNLGELFKLFRDEIKSKYLVPRRELFYQIKPALKYAQTIGYPVVCKGLTKGAYISKNAEELKHNIIKISDIWNGGEIACIVEEYISGRHINCVVAINNCEIVGFVEMEKIGIDTNGATWFGKIRKTKELLLLAQELIRLNNFDTSIIEIETIERDGKYFIYEINPRAPGWIYSPSLLGINLPKLVISPEQRAIKFVPKEGFFGREIQDFIRDDIEYFGDNIKYYAKGAAYKSQGMKYPSDFL